MYVVIVLSIALSRDVYTIHYTLYTIHYNTHTLIHSYTRTPCTPQESSELSLPIQADAKELPPPSQNQGQVDKAVRRDSGSSHGSQENTINNSYGQRGSAGIGGIGGTGSIGCIGGIRTNITTPTGPTTPP